MLKKIVFAAIIIVPFIAYGQDTRTDLERWEDSVAAAKRAESASQRAPKPIDTSGSIHGLSLSYFATRDSFERAVMAEELQWSACRRLRDVVTVKDRIDALSFYLKKSVMPRDSVEKYALILQTEKATEYNGTEYIIANQYGSEKVKAHAHLIKLRKDMALINDFIFSLNNQKIAIKK
jgi:hypothetical protein